MNYIYGELNRDMLPKELDLYYGLSHEMVLEELPGTSIKCENPEKLRIEGEYTQLYTLGEYASPKYPYFSYPAKYGKLSFIASNEGIINEIRNWENNLIKVNGTNYYLWCYKGQLAPGRSFNILFRIIK